MLNIDLKIVFVFIFLLLAVWRVRKGFENGMVQEIVNILSAAVSCVCIVLIFLTVSSVKAHTYSVLTLCVFALIAIGIVFKACTLIFKPLTAIVNVSLINSLDKFLGAIFGFGEALIFGVLLYFILDYAGVFIF